MSARTAALISMWSTPADGPLGDSKTREDE